MLKLPFLTIGIAPSSPGMTPLSASRCPTPQSAGRRYSRMLLSLFVGSAIALTGCQNQSAREGQINTATAPEPTVTPAAPTTPNTAPAQPSVAATPKAATVQLPQTLVRTWEPESKVLFEFGAMTLTPDTIAWNSGQTSAYTVISTHAGYLLRLEAAPKFFDTAQPYIKLIPQTDSSGAVNEVEIAFYESQQKAENDEYIMLGTYVGQ